MEEVDDAVQLSSLGTGVGDVLLPGAESANHRRKHESLFAATDELSQSRGE